ncbi:DUF4350 domain-containing protein [Pyrococcus abyssi]|uniref:DUF4350 domain-containing protein n=1 Tax=Pyrococcus abyssi (strain GE5 / Orsay) TaxID=272844 RepID=Q9UYA5_PYRAB|nr:DUF4350 domain-containing protein [Pyrococcus abyssi]CAB50507.1 Hypothetical protein PAB1295 [Pyrococcus abyssi GE5]CCE71062.1 TPA: hypothetical protein PAB1295 [Pyrococcus abyssi GE5]
MRRVVYFTLLAIGVAFLIMPVSIPVILTNVEFSIFNTGWNGCSSFAKLLYQGGEIVPVFYPLNSVSLGEEGTLLIIGPDLSYSTFEIERIRSFVLNGGTLILIDDFGTGNEILSGLNLTVRFSKKVPISIFYFKDYRLPEVIYIDDPYLSVGVEKLILNVPSVLIGANGSAYTSRITLLGRNLKSYPILSEIRYGKGRIILFSDPSVFTNEMMTYNRKFVENFISKYVSYPVYIDEAHHSNFNPYHVGTVVIRRSLNKERVFYVTAFVAVIMLLVESGLAMNVILTIIEKLYNITLKLFGEVEEEDLGKVIEELEKKGFDRRILDRIIKEVKVAGGLENEWA